MSDRPTYAQWFEIVRLARHDYESFSGVRFREGVERAAALAALEQQERGCGRHACLKVIEEAFESMRMSINPRWDGSIA